uniref:CCHC-type domain-containing protein n=1 Tax=Meloidogyne javanica TaxID=6303 RepID=A0A915MW58_MELJA
MPNANLVPLENVRRWPRDLKKEIQTNNFQFTSGACTKCGNFGHLTWQCHTFTQKKKTKNVYISSNSSKEEINSLLKTNENVHTSWSITDSCISLESQKESFNERIQKLEIEKDKMNKVFEQLLEKFNEQNSLQHPSSTFSYKEFVTFDDLENHPFIQQMKEKLKLLDQKTSDQKIQNDANHYKSENERIFDLYNKQQVKNKTMGSNIANLARINRKLKEELNISNNKINQLQEQINKNSRNVNEQTDEKFKDFGGQVDIKLETNSELLEEQNGNKMV